MPTHDDETPRGRENGAGDNTALASRLHMAAIHLVRLLRGEDDELGLGAPQLSALSTLIRSGPMTMSDLATAEHVRLPTMTRLVQRLEHEQLVVRATSERDRRVITVAATHRAWGTLEQARARRVDSLARAVARLEEAEIRTLARAVPLIERLIEASATSPERSGPPDSGPAASP
jgi:DNA-binding MarR family transcriptional regulator